jgi:hypothetical protein
MSVMASLEAQGHRECFNGIDDVPAQRKGMGEMPMTDKRGRRHSGFAPENQNDPYTPHDPPYTPHDPYTPQVVKDALRRAPADTYVLFAASGDLSRSLAECGPDLAARLAPRVVLLDVSWQKALEQLEQHRLAGAVDSLRLSEWLAPSSNCAGPFGLRYLAQPLGASCAPLPALRSAHYCLLQSQQHRGMPHLLADYLVAYDRDQKPLGALASVALARVPPTPAEDAAGTGTAGPGAEVGALPAAQVESVSIKRVIESLRRATTSAGMTLAQVAE